MKRGTTGQVSEGNLPTITKIVANPTSGDVPLKVAFHAEAEGGLQPYSGWTWDFGNGMVKDDPNGYGHTSSDMPFTYQDPGQWQVSLIVKDNIGNPSAPATVQVTSTSPPVTMTLKANPQSGRVPLTVHFETKYGGGNGSAYLLKVDFGDGQQFARPIKQAGSAPSYTADFDHNYIKSGQYTANVCVYDAILDKTCSSITIIVS